MIARCVDLESRLHSLDQWQVDEAFINAKKQRKPILLSYFSHDHRDMRNETYRAIDMIQKSSKKFNVKYAWCDALEAIQICENIKPINVKIGFEVANSFGVIKIYFDKEIYQKNPFVYTQDNDGNIAYHKLDIEHIPNCPYYLKRCFLYCDKSYKRLGGACTSMSGNKSILVKEIKDIL